MDNAAAYSKTDAVTYVQTPLYIDKELSLANSALEQYVGMIKNESYYGSTDSANPDWNNLYVYNDAFNSAWDAYIDMYLNTWGGQAMIDEYSAEASKYLK